jgi:hypothetical protein
MHERLRIGIEGFNTAFTAEFYDLPFVNLGVSFLRLTEWAIDH